MKTDAPAPDPAPAATPAPEATPQTPAPEQAAPETPKGSDLAVLGEAFGMAPGATPEEFLQRAAALRELEAKAAQPTEPKPDKGKDDASPDAARLDVLFRELASSKLEAEIGARGFTPQQRALVMKTLGGSVTFDEQHRVARGPHGVHLKTAVDQVVAEFSDFFKTPAKSIPTPSEPPPPAGQEANNGRRLQLMEDLKF